MLETDAEVARGIGRRAMAVYLKLPNYANNLLRLGWTEDDLAHGGTDALVDAIVAWGDESAIKARVQAHLARGANHVCIQVLTADPRATPMPEWRRLAAALLEPPTTLASLGGV